MYRKFSLSKFLVFGKILCFFDIFIFKKLKKKKIQNYLIKKTILSLNITFSFFLYNFLPKFIKLIIFSNLILIFSILHFFPKCIFFLLGNHCQQKKIEKKSNHPQGISIPPYEIKFKMHVHKRALNFFFLNCTAKFFRPTPRLYAFFHFFHHHRQGRELVCAQESYSARTLTPRISRVHTYTTFERIIFNICKYYVCMSRLFVSVRC